MYTYKNKEYKIVREAQMKDVTSRDWHECVIYEQVETGLVFVREAVEFYFKFEMV
jgi:hypothetical protein